MAAFIVQLIGVWRVGELEPTVPVETAKQIDWPRGTSGAIQLHLIDSNGTPVVLGEGETVVLSVGEPAAAGAVVLTKTGTALGEQGRYQFELTRDDTVALSGHYVMDVVATRGGNDQQVVAPSYFHVTPRIQP